MTAIWISEFNWHRLRRMAVTPVTWEKITDRRRDRGGKAMVKLPVDDDVLAALKRVDPDPDKAITITFNGFTPTQHT